MRRLDPAWSSPNRHPTVQSYLYGRTHMHKKSPPAHPHYSTCPATFSSPRNALCHPRGRLAYRIMLLQNNRIVAAVPLACHNRISAPVRKKQRHFPRPGSRVSTHPTVQGNWKSRLNVQCAVTVDSETPTRLEGEGDAPTDADAVVIGSGVGGLSCAAVLAKYGLKVVVVESHSVPGGAAHSWPLETDSGVYRFESGPSFYSGMKVRGKDAHPLGHVFQAIGEDLEMIEYDTWNLFVPEGKFFSKVGAGKFLDIIDAVKGPNSKARKEWEELEAFMKDLGKSAALFPLCALRSDWGAIFTVLGRYPLALLGAGPEALKLGLSFSEVLKGHVTDKFILNYLDLLCFMLSGLPADGTLTAEMAVMFHQWFRPGVQMEFPKGGCDAVAKGLIRGLEKNNGKLLLNSHVDQILIEQGRAVGVQLKSGRVIKAKKAVVSNAFLWDMVPLLPPGQVPKDLLQRMEEPLTNSFMHLHVGFDATGLDNLNIHYILVDDWDKGVEAEQNVVLVSIPSAVDPDFAPPGKHALHAYLPSTEPYELWEGLDPNSDEYKALKKERSEVLWTSLEKIVPDIRERAEVSVVGTPLTHSQYLRRYRGTYGPAIKAGEGTFPGPKTSIPGLYCCGDSTFPGMGLPAVATSGFIAANTIVPVWEHWKVLDEMNV